MRTVLLLAALAIGCDSAKYAPVAEVPTLTSLKDVMDNQAGAADPEFKKIGQARFDEADFVGFAEMAHRLEATHLRMNDFSKGKDFDALATKLDEKARALGAAAVASDGTAANAALGDLKGLCKQCHSKYR